MGQLDFADWEEISRGIATGASARQIAVAVGRPASTVSREIARHGGRERYRAHEAHARAALNRRRPKTTKLTQMPLLRDIVEAKLALRWSPDQISRVAGPHPSRRGGDAGVAGDDLPVVVRPAMA